jgi:uncharacterized protein (DUF488 family)
VATRVKIPKPNMGTIVSIGYEGRDLSGFLATLRQNRVEVLVDVRLTPISRKKGFSKTALSAALNDAGIEYRHVRELGNPKENRDPFRNGQAAAGRRVFLAHLNNGSRSAYDDVVELARTRRIALLCVERDDRECHRGCITDQAQDENPALSVVRA